jgi:DNA primase
MDNREQIEEIKSKLDISIVIAQYVPSLKRSGRNFFGLCPFHKEKSPSFSVNPELGMFKCFGCGEGGDVIKFLEKIEGLDFPNALELAAQKAGVTLKKQFSPQQEKFKEEKARLLEANKLTAQYYNYVLLQHEMGEIGRAYATKRKLKTEQIKDFYLGFAPKSFDNLRNFLRKKGFNDQELVKWGLLVNKNNKIYDKFRSRLMFPIMNHQGEFVGFSGRKITEDEFGPKYLNSPETLVYKKSHLLFGLYQAKDTIRDTGFVILVEGNIDLMSSHGAGVKNIVAPLGTALTEEQLKIVKRYCEKIYFAFDADSAGQKALLKSFTMAENLGLESYVLSIRGFKDVDELIVAGENWQDVINKPIETVAYLIRSRAKQYDMNNTNHKKKYVAEIMPFLLSVKSDVALSDYLHRVAEITDITIETLSIELEKVKKIVKTQTSEDPSEEQFAPEILLPKKLGMEQLIVEFLALILNNKNYYVEEDFVSKVFGNGLAFALYDQIVLGHPHPELAGYESLITNIKMQATQEIDDERVFTRVLNNLGQRIIRAKAHIEIKKLKHEMTGEDSEAMKKVYETAKLLKS